MEGYAPPFHRDRNAHGGGLMIYLKNNIPYKEVKPRLLPNEVEVIIIEIVIKKEKWLLIGGYNPCKEKTAYFLSHLSKEIDAHLSSYENLILLGDFNAISTNASLMEFCEMYSLSNLITDPTCFKNPDNPSSIDIILTNRKRSSENSYVIETGLSDHHKMIYTIMKCKIQKKQEN